MATVRIERYIATLESEMDLHEKPAVYTTYSPAAKSGYPSTFVLGGEANTNARCLSLRVSTSFENVCGGGWSTGSVVKRTSCSSREPRFNIQQPHGGSQWYNSNPRGSQVLVWLPGHCIYIHAGETPTYKISNLKRETMCEFGYLLHIRPCTLPSQVVA